MTSTSQAMIKATNNDNNDNNSKEVMEVKNRMQLKFYGVCHKEYKKQSSKMYSLFTCQAITKYLTQARVIKIGIKIDPQVFLCLPVAGKGKENIYTKK